jgi:hypothetical protein
VVDFLVAKCFDDGRNRQGKSNKGACNTASWPPNINPTDEANAPLIYATISAKCSDDGQLLRHIGENGSTKK